MPYGFLFLAVASLGMIGVLHKVADHRRCRPEAINLFIFLGGVVVMSVLSFWRFGAAGVLDTPRIAWVTAATCGLLASLAILSFQRGVRYGKISTSWLVINLSMAVPTVLSIVVYREEITRRRAVGLLLAVATLVILWRERVREEASGEVIAIAQVPEK
ncbi:EamA family transporter [Edaphobacter albus]|uniref:EamA family transporter n=1 Tax=Edaphobacter sp. 4G125 TaxID=2763071 RepID=UPI00164633E4|nr:EamA family transporter [Edaphobacter sp. 4G125]QNI37675.1 EamA family transporter [Edaphobacter sp. 4G125]